MTDRNEPELDWTFEARFESLAERRIREAMEEGQFDDLPGAGRPIPGLAEPHDELWWIRKWLARDDVPGAEVRGLKRRRPPAR